MIVTDETPIAMLTVGELKKVFSQISAKQEESPRPRVLKENMSPDEAVTMLNDNGYKITKPTLYYMTSKRQIPHSKFGRTLVFSEKELIEWATNKTQKKVTR
jgi:hypothetical protein